MLEIERGVGLKAGQLGEGEGYLGEKLYGFLNTNFAPPSRQVRKKRLLKCFTAPLFRLLRLPPTLFLRRAKKKRVFLPFAAAAVAEGVFTAFPLSRCVGTFPQKFSSRTGTLVGQVEYSYIHWQFFLKKNMLRFLHKVQDDSISANTGKGKMDICLKKMLNIYQNDTVFQQRECSQKKKLQLLVKSHEKYSLAHFSFLSVTTVWSTFPPQTREKVYTRRHLKTRARKK